MTCYQKNIRCWENRIGQDKLGMIKAVATLKSDFIEQSTTELWEYISPLYSVDESNWLTQLLEMNEIEEKEEKSILASATSLIEQVRSDKNSIQMIDALLLEYSLDKYHLWNLKKLTKR